MSVTFDTLEFVNQLKAVDVPDAQAQVQARALRLALDASRAHDAERMATKEDLHKVHADIALVRKDMEMMRKDLIIKIGSMFGVSVGLIVAAIGMAVRYLA